MKGSRVILSEKGMSISPRKVNSIATIVGESRDGRCWRISWDDAKGIVSYHKSFLDVLEPETVKYLNRNAVEEKTQPEFVYAGDKIEIIVRRGFMKQHGFGFGTIHEVVGTNPVKKGIDVYLRGNPNVFMDGIFKVKWYEYKLV